MARKKKKKKEKKKEKKRKKKTKRLVFGRQTCGGSKGSWLPLS
jgi:hypothetical protein